MVTMLQGSDANTPESSTGEVVQTESGTTPSNEGAVTRDQGAQSETTDSGSPAEGTDSGAKGPSTSLEAAKAALGEAGTAADSPTAGKSEDGKRPAEQAAVDDKSTAIDKAIADKSVPFHNHPRWKEVTTTAKALEGQVGELTPKAQRWDALDAKFRETGMAPADVDQLFNGGAMLKRAGVLPEEVDNLMRVGAAMKLGDREVVLQLAKPVFESLGLQIVPLLPQEIQERIEQGAITEEDGRKLAEVQFEARKERALRERAETRIQERDNVDNADRQQQAFTRASASWEASVRQTDADFALKEPHIVEAIQALVKQRPPQNEKEVVAICQMAYDQVSRIMRTAAPATRPRPVVPARSGSSNATTPVPRNSLEAARIALQRG